MNKIKNTILTTSNFTPSPINLQVKRNYSNNFPTSNFPSNWFFSNDINILKSKWKIYSYKLTDNILTPEDIKLSLEGWQNRLTTEIWNNEIILQFRLRINEEREIPISFVLNFNTVDYDNLFSLFCAFLSLKGSSIRDVRGDWKASHIIIRYKYILDLSPKEVIDLDQILPIWQDYTYSIPDSISKQN